MFNVNNKYLLSGIEKNLVLSLIVSEDTLSYIGIK